MKTFTYLILFALLFPVSLLAERPNVILIISDDHAWTDYGFLGNEKIRSPHIDQLAAEGLTFTRGYVTTALCSPSLATMLTGLYTHQHGITGNDPVKGKDREVWLDRFFENPMLPKLLADAGYNTLHTGKYWMRQPSAAGFTHDIGETGRHGGKSLDIGRKTMKPIYDFMDQSIESKKPFFVWYAPFLPHTPHNPPKRLLDKYADVQPAKKAKYYAMVEWLDETCGDLMKNLKDKGVDDNTLVLYLADNGWNEFGKASPYENGIRTPIIARWPARIKAHKEEMKLASNIDVVPTILTACGVKVPKAMPGINLLDNKAVSDRTAIFFNNFSHNMISAHEPGKSLWTRSVIQGKWKLITYQDPLPKERPNAGGHNRKYPDQNQELFDLLADPHETKDLSKEHAAVVTELQARMNGWWDPNKVEADDTETGERARPLLGVQRWDMFSGKGATQQKELGYLPGGAGFLKDSQWHDRVPFFCRLTKDVDWVKHPAAAGPVWFNHPFSQELLQESMDQELRYAHDAGIDFFVYHGPARKLYANGWELRNNFDCHLASKIPEAKKVNFTWALYAHRAIRYTRSKVDTMMNETIEYIKMPNWQTVMDGRPLIVVYHPERFRAALQVAKGKEHMTGAEFVGYVRARVEAEGLKNPYIVGCMEPRDSFLHAKILKKEGYDAFMDYEGTYGGRVAKRDEAPTYAEATEEILKTCEQEFLNRGLPFLPPCPSMFYRWPHAFDRKGRPREEMYHFQWPKEGELAKRVKAVLDFVAAHPKDCDAQTVIMYSWNEHSGGGGICPTMGKPPEYKPETQWLDEVAEAMTAWKYPPSEKRK